MLKVKVLGQHSAGIEPPACCGTVAEGGAMLPAEVGALVVPSAISFTGDKLGTEGAFPPQAGLGS